MKYVSKSFTISTGLLLAMLVGATQAQENLPLGPSNHEHDLQLFAPFDLDLDNMVDDQWSGYFGEYNKLYWAYSGERVTVGNEELTDTLRWRNPATGLIEEFTGDGQFAEVIYRFNPVDADFTEGDIVTLPPPHLIENTIKYGPPRASFAFGDRYEFGYRDQGHGWLVGILDGPEQTQTQFYGFARGPNGELPPFIDDDYTGPDDVSGEDRDLITADPGLRAFGWGSVPILFETPPGYLLGFRDYVNNFADAMLGTQGGPELYIGNYSGTQEPDDLPIPFFRLADDIDADGVIGAFPIAVVVNGIATFAFVHDFDDLHEFNIFFDSVTIQSHTETDGVELMWTHDLTNQHYMAKHKNNRVSVGWGARFLRMRDRFRVDALGSILGDSFWDTQFTNQIVGPQIALKWVNQRQRWRINADGRLLFGYNVADWTQNGLMGEDLIPGALNRPLYARPTAFSDALQEQQFSPVAELRVQSSYHVTSSFALKLGFTSTYAGAIYRAAPSVDYRLPSMGYKDDAGTQTLLINGVDFGVEFVH